MVGEAERDVGQYLRLSPSRHRAQDLEARVARRAGEALALGAAEAGERLLEDAGGGRGDGGRGGGLLAGGEEGREVDDGDETVGEADEEELIRIPCKANHSPVIIREAQPDVVVDARVGARREDEKVSLAHAHGHVGNRALRERHQSRCGGRLELLRQTTRQSRQLELDLRVPLHVIRRHGLRELDSIPGGQAEPVVGKPDAACDGGAMLAFAVRGLYHRTRLVVHCHLSGGGPNGQLFGAATPRGAGGGGGGGVRQRQRPRRRRAGAAPNPRGGHPCVP
mmetsp:Transcript_30214/g.97529  ORF Transcript_30214/g.97529 Transcript_30214/m.97529 type:complete len:280 (+) Transcript_30214:1375-2214(+)